MKDWQRWEELAKDMRFVAAELDAQPDGRKWAAPETDALDGLRHEAVRLRAAVEAIFEELMGG
jgi:hypothetical protein